MMKNSVLIADKFPDSAIEELKSLGLEVTYSPKLGEQDLVSAAVDTNIIVVRSTVVNADTINSANNLKLIIRAGSGVNNINIPAAKAKGVYVANCPGMNSIAVAELAIGLIISLDRRIPSNVIDFHSGIWNKGEYSKAEGLFGKNIAIVGYGAIGKEVAKRALAFGMKVYAKDVFPIDDPNVTVFTEFENTLPEMDAISFHLPSNAQTKGLINKEVLSLLKPGCIIVNTSRADIIDEDALLEAVETKKLKVALDVFKGEPEQKDGAVSSKFVGKKNIYVTHHIGASTEQAQNAVSAESIRIIKEFITNGVNSPNLKKNIL